MATNNTKSPKLLGSGRWHLSWKRLFVAGSVVLNIAFIVLTVSLLISNSLDGLFMADGLQRYCSSANDNKFKDSTQQVKALRDYVCDTSAAHPYFQQGLRNYLNAKGVPYNQ